MKRKLACLLGVALFTFGCGGDDSDLLRRELIVSWVDGQLFPRLEETQQALVVLNAAVDNLCQEPSAAKLSASQEAWRDSRVPFKRAEVFAFGPYKQHPIRLGPKMDSWPARPTTVDALMESGDPITAESLEALGVYTRGFPALEYLLFDSEVDLVAEFGNERRCEYTNALVENLQNNVERWEKEWRVDEGNYLDKLIRPKEHGEYETVLEAMGEVVNRVGFTLENIRKDKLESPLEGAGGLPDPPLAESRFSDNSVADMRENLMGLHGILFNGEDTMGLETYWTEYGFDYKEQLEDGLLEIELLLREIETPFADALYFEEDELRMTMEKLFETQVLLQEEVMPALKITVLFNDGDGD